MPDMSLPVIAGLITHGERGALPVLLKFLKSAVVVAILVYLQIKFSRVWARSGLERLERWGKSLGAARGAGELLSGLRF